MWPRKNKFNNSPARLMGISFRSRAERDYALFLESERQLGRIKKWEYEKSYDLTVEGITICKHKPDFTVTLPDGRFEIREVKGGLATQTEAWRLKKKLFRACYPGVAYVVLHKNYSSGGFYAAS